jgi:ubiquinone/menaquinone biosynthesis C-methylase UbiE
VIDFDPLAASYDRLRPAGSGWHELADRALAALGRPRRLLDVGCGTGRFAVLAAERLGARVWGVDPSPDMLAQARARGARGIGWRQATAERLPFRDGWFDAAHAHLVLHLVDLDAALPEIARVLAPDGRLAAVTFFPDHFERFYLVPYFPSIVRIDRARFPAPDGLVARLRDVGFADAAAERVSQARELDPRDVLDRVRGRYISTLQLLAADEYADGLERLERDVERGRGPFAGRLEWAVVTARRAGPPARR